MEQINSLPDKELKVILIRMLTELWKRIDEFSENFNKQLESIKKNQSELKYTITEMNRYTGRN